MIEDRGVSHERVYLVLTVALQVVLLAGVVGFIILGEWANGLLTGAVILLTLAPRLLRRPLRIDVPPEFQFAAAVFMFLAMFLGMGLGFYARFPWWDLALHTASGFLLGIVGFIALFVINGLDSRPEGMRPAFLAVFGFTFAVTLGVLWEIYEFLGDTLVPSWDMQIRREGVRDTMVDLIVDAAGAAVVALLGYAYCRTGRFSFLADWVTSFLRRNPRLLSNKRAGQTRTADPPDAK
ncbi:MAG TPA: hypothetical protein VIT42_04845 [Microlunatus sp.]